MLNNERNGLYGGIGGKNSAQLEQITNQGEWNKTLFVTQAEYDAIVTKDDNTIYMITEE